MIVTPKIYSVYVANKLYSANNLVAIISISF